MDPSLWTKSIADKAGISEFEVGFFTINEQNIEVIHIWSALVTMKHGSFCVAIIKSDKWRRGYIVVPEQVSEKQEITSDEIPHVVEVDLSDWLDPVEVVLHVMDVLPEIKAFVYDGVSCSIFLRRRLGKLGFG